MNERKHYAIERDIISQCEATLYFARPLFILTAEALERLEDLSEGLFLISEGVLSFDLQGLNNGRIKIYANPTLCDEIEPKNFIERALYQLETLLKEFTVPPEEDDEEFDW